MYLAINSNSVNELPEDEQDKLKDWMYNLLYELLQKTEKHYTEELYDDLGWTEEVKTFLRYNANKALMNSRVGFLNCGIQPMM